MPPLPPSLFQAQALGLLIPPLGLVAPLSVQDIRLFSRGPGPVQLQIAELELTVGIDRAQEAEQDPSCMADIYRGRGTLHQEEVSTQGLNISLVPRLSSHHLHRRTWSCLYLPHHLVHSQIRRMPSFHHHHRVLFRARPTNKDSQPIGVHRAGPDSDSLLHHHHHYLLA